MGKPTLVLLTTLALPSLLTAQVPVRAPAQGSQAQIVGCYRFPVDSLIGTADATLPLVLQLTAAPADSGLARLPQPFRAAMRYYRFRWTPTDSSSEFEFSPRPVWYRVAPDSIEVDLSGRGKTPRYTIRARVIRDSLVGAIGIQDSVEFRWAIRFVAPRRECGPSVPSN